VGDGLVLQLLLLVALIIGSGLLSGAEAAYFSLRPRAPASHHGRTAGGHDGAGRLEAARPARHTARSASRSSTSAPPRSPRTWRASCSVRAGGLLVELIAMVILLTTFGEVLPMTLRR